MRRFKIGIDGVDYDVTVEELGNSEPTVSSAPVVPKVSSQATAKQPAQPAVSTTPSPSIGNAAPGDIVSPLAGTIISVNVSVGQAVKSGEALLVLDAMKMESAVFAPSDGTVKSIPVSKDQAVQEGQILLSLG